jgi:hypothetical protein
MSSERVFSNMKVASIRDIASLSLDVTEICGHTLGDAEVLVLAEKGSLKSLDLSGSDLVTDISVMELSKLTQLSELDLSFCNLITDRSLEALGHLPHLRRLSLNACYSVTDAGLSALAKATSLEVLSLWSCEEVTDAGVESLSRLPRLRQLELPEFADITDVGLKALATNPASLEVLRLDHLARISDEGIGALRSLKRLSKLTVQSCQEISKAGIASLQSALPGCQIIFGQ